MTDTPTLPTPASPEATTTPCGQLRKPLPEKLDNFWLVHSELTDSIYIAQMKAGSNYALHKIERTDHFLAVLLRWCPIGYIRDIVVGESLHAVVTVTDFDIKQALADEKAKSDALRALLAQWLFFAENPSRDHGDLYDRTRPLVAELVKELGA